MPTLFTITVDTEEEWDWACGWPTEQLKTSNIRNLPRFQEVCSRHGAAVTYFSNYAALQNVEARRVLREVASQPRVEIGMHIHPWNTPPLRRNGPVSARETFLHNLPDDEVCAKMASVYERFRENGWKPTSFRGGRYSSGGVVHDFLREKGFLADASVLPYTTWSDDGAPDYRWRDLLPVRRPPRCPSEQALWEIPLTLGFTRRPFAFWSRCYDWIAKTPLRHLRLIGLAEKARLVRKVWLSFEDPLGRCLLPFLQMLRRAKLPCVCFTLHSSSLMAGGNAYTPTRAAEARLFADVDEVLGVVAGWEDFRPATVTEVALHLEREHHARTGN
jgi:hypothetical protein